MDDYLRLIQSIWVVCLVYLISIILIRIVNSRIKDIKLRHHKRKGILYFTTFLNILILAVIWIDELNKVRMLLSILGAGLVVALQEVILCVAGWFVIFLRRPIQAGDRVEFGGVKGDVINIGLHHTALLEIGNWVEDDQSTGRVVEVPNSAIFKGPVYNYTHGFEFIWNEIKITVTFESDWKKAKDIILDIGKREGGQIEKKASGRIDKMADKYMIFYEKFGPIVYTKIVDNGIELSLRYLTEAQSRRVSTDRISSGILEEFNKHKDINFAYPTYRITGVK